jgi:RHS repeat-associated protein
MKTRSLSTTLLQMLSWRRFTSLLLLSIWLMQPGLAFAQTTTTTTTYAPQALVSGLNFPTFLKTINSPYAKNAPGTLGQASSVLTYGNLLVGNAGQSGTNAKTILQIKPSNATSSVFASNISTPFALSFWDTGSPLTIKGGSFKFDSVGNLTQLTSSSSKLIRIFDGSNGKTAGSTTTISDVDEGVSSVATINNSSFFFSKSSSLKVYALYSDDDDDDDDDNDKAKAKNEAKVIAKDSDDDDDDDDDEAKNYSVSFSQNGAFKNAFDMVFVPALSSAPGVGKLYVIDSGTSLKIYLVTQQNSSQPYDKLTATLNSTITANLSNPISLALQPSNGHIWVSNRRDGSITVLDSNGVLVRRISTNLGGAQLWGLTFQESSSNTVDTLYLTTTGGVGVTPTSTPAGKLQRLVLSPLKVVDPLPGYTTSTALSGPMLMRFSQPIDARTLTTQVVSLTTQAGQNVGIGVSLSSPDVLSVVPQQPLTDGVTYNLSVRPGLKDIYGNTLTQAFTAPFLATAPPNPNTPFTLTLTPLTTKTVPGSTANFGVQAALIPGANFSGLISLQALSLPSGVTASFAQNQIAPGQTTTLSLNVASTVALGDISVRVRGSAPISGQSLSATSNTSTLSVISLGGNTVFYGQVRSDETIPKPLAGVIVRPFCKVATANINTCNPLDTTTTSATTDGNGYFTLTLPVGSQSLPPAGTPLILFVDGRGLSNATQQFAAAKTSVNFQVGQWNTTPFIVHLPVIKSGTTAITVPGGSQIESTAYPNTRVFIPTGTRLYSYIEQKNVLPSDLQISFVDPGKLPQPLPTGVDTAMASTIQPGGTQAFDAAGNLSVIQVTYANLTHELPGTKLALWSVTRDDRWYQYGFGLVSDDGRRIEPKPCMDGEVNNQSCAAIGQKVGQPYGLQELSWHFAQPSPVVGPPGEADQGTNSGFCLPCAIAQILAGDPVDNATGTFTDQYTDIAVQGGRVPFAYSRGYRTLDKNFGPFGVGTYDNYGMFLQSVGSGVVTLIMPDNSRYLFSISSTGTSYVNESDITFRGDTITKTGSGYTWRTKSGEVMIFSAGGLLLSITDRNGNTITITRTNPDNGAITQISSTSGTLNFGLAVFNINGQTLTLITSITDQDGRTTNYDYNPQNQLIKVTRPDSTFWSYTYDPATGFMATAKDPRQTVSMKNTYDAAGRVIRQEQAEGRVYQWQYIQNNPSVTRGIVGQTKVIMPNGNVETYTFDGSRYPNGSTDPLGQSSQITRSVATNEVTAITDSVGRTNQVTYDSNGNVISSRDAQGNIRKVTYESQYNLPKTATDSLNHTSTITYDTKGNPIRMDDALSHGATLQYDQYGQVISSKNDVDALTSMTYDDRGRVIKVTAPLGRIASASYDNLNRVISSTDPLGRTVQYQYDVLNRVKKAIYPDATFVTMTYDENSNLKALSDEKGNTTSYNYDQMNRLVKRTNPLGQYSTYQYDYNNNLKQIIDRQGRTTTFDYNSRDELIRTTLFDGTIINRTYDAVGRLVTLDDSRDGRIDWEYDILDRVVKETTSQGTVAYAYDTEGKRTTLSAPNGYTVSYGYDAADRVTTITKGSQNFQLGYDAADRMTGMTMPNGIAASYSFDAAGRINRILYQKGAQVLKDFQYTLDVADQITQIAGTPAHTFGDNLVSTSAVNQNNQYTTFGSDSLSHDASGNLKTKGQTTYQWDVRDRLISISGSGVTASFSYDALGRRTSKTVNGQTLGYQYDGADIIQDSNSQYLQGLGIDDVLSRTTNGNNEYYLKDHLGSTVALADQSGSLTTQYGYSPYGQVSKTGTSSSNYFTYTGREDDNTGLYYYRARYYSPDLKRFTAEDPIGFSGGQSNLYAYVGTAPISSVDPTGTQVELLPKAIPTEMLKPGASPELFPPAVASPQSTDTGRTKDGDYIIYKAPQQEQPYQEWVQRGLIPEDFSKQTQFVYFAAPGSRRLAEDYASRGAYCGDILELVIGKKAYERFFQPLEKNFEATDGLRGTKELPIPKGMLDVLNRSTLSRKLVTYRY